MDYLLQKIISYRPEALFYFQDSTNRSDYFGGTNIALTSATSRSGIRYGNPYTTKCTGFTYEFQNLGLSEKITFCIVGQFYGGIIFECQGNEISHDGFKLTIRNLAGEEKSLPYHGETSMFVISLDRETFTLTFDGLSMFLDNEFIDEEDIALMSVVGYSLNTTLDIFAVFRDASLLEAELPMSILGLDTDRDDIAARCVDSEANGVFNVELIPETLSDSIVKKESLTDLPPDANSYKLNWQQSSDNLIYVDGQSVNNGYWNNTDFEEAFFVGSQLEGPVTMTYYTDNKLNDQNELADIVFGGSLGSDEKHSKITNKDTLTLDTTNYFIDPNWIRASGFNGGGASTTSSYNSEGFARGTFTSEIVNSTINTGWNLVQGGTLVAPGEAWSGRLQMRTNRAGKFYFYLQFLGATGNNIGNNIFQLDLLANAWGEFSIQNAIAPAGAVSIRLLAYGYDSTRGWLVGDWLDVRQISLTRGAIAEPSFSGDTNPDKNYVYKWTGAIGNSTSERYAMTDIQGIDYGINYAENPAIRSTDGSAVVATNVAPNPGAENSSGWLSNNGAVYPVTRSTFSRSGSNSARATLLAESTASLSIHSLGALTSSGFPIPAVMEGRDVYMSVWLYPSDDGPIAEGNIGFQTRIGAGAWSTSAYGPASALPRNQWTRVNMNASIPAGSTDLRAFCTVRRLSGETGLYPVGALSYADDCTVSLYPSDSFSGDTPADDTFTYNWTGTPNASTSEKVGKRVATLAHNGNYTTWVQTPRFGRNFGLLQRIDNTVENWGTHAGPANAVIGEFWAAKVELAAATLDAVGKRPSISIYDGGQHVYGPSSIPAPGLTLEPQWYDVSGTMPLASPAVVRMYLYRGDADPFKPDILIGRHIVGKVSAAGEQLDSYFDGSSAPTDDGLFYSWSGLADGSISYRHAKVAGSEKQGSIIISAYSSVVGYSFWAEPDNGSLSYGATILAGVISGSGLYVNGLPYTGQRVTSRFHVFVPSTSQEFGIFAKQVSDIIIHETLPNYLDNYLRFFSNKSVSVNLTPFSLTTQTPLLNSPRWTVVN